MIANSGSILFFLILLIFPFQEEPIHNEINNKLANYSWSHPVEKAYIHTDKSFYVAGEDIWFKAYLMVGPYHIPDTLSSVLYVELINDDGTITDIRRIHMREGLGYGDFDLPTTIPPGKYILKAYTRYMQNFDPAFQFRKWILILPVLQIDRQKNNNRQTIKTNVIENTNYTPIQIQFFPEGGNMVGGLPNYIAFKVTDQQGIGKEVEGIIKNSRGNEITKFKSQKFGLGFFTIKPDAAEEYTASISFQGQEYQYTIPKPIKRGYAMHINKTGNNVYIWVRNNMGIRMSNTFVIGQFRGFPFITIHAKQDQNYLYSVLNSNEIPSGIIHFTFFDSLGIPQCERLVYTENEKERIDFNIESNKKTYKKREKSFFKIHCENLDGLPILTNLSLSITNIAIVNKDDSRSHIRSYFNLESDLKGNIENPGYYFNPENEDRYELLDILLLTHGWRRFVWKEILEDQFPTIKFPAEAGFNIEGRLVDFYEQTKIQPGHLRIFIYENQFYYGEVETDINGLFQFEGLDIYDSTHIVMQAWRLAEKARKQKKNKPPKTKNDLAIKIYPQSLAAITPEYWPGYIKEEETYAQYLEQNDFILKIDSSFEGRTIILDELLIEDKKIDLYDPFNRPGKLYKEPSNRIVMDSIPVADQSLLLFDMIRKYIPGLIYSGAPPNIQIIIRGPRSIYGSNQPLILLDGIEVESDFMYYFPPAEIAFVDILKSGNVAMYGGKAGNGVIAFYTKMESVHYPEEGRKGMINFIYPGYYMAREFYSPNYDIPDEKQIKPDYRRTLYWNPSLTTDDHGDITFSFYTSDEKAEYRVEIEGMTYSGIPITNECYFSVE